MTTPFNATPNSTFNLTVTSVSSSVFLNGSAGSNALVTNTGSSKCYVRLGASGIAAATSDMTVLSNSALVLTRDVIRDLYAAAISESGESTTVKVTLGTGS
jgi:hypothetical protein